MTPRRGAQTNLTAQHITSGQFPCCAEVLTREELVVTGERTQPKPEPAGAIAHTSTQHRGARVVMQCRDRLSANDHVTEAATVVVTDQILPITQWRPHPLLGVFCGDHLHLFVFLRCGSARGPDATHPRRPHTWDDSETLCLWYR